MRGLCAAHELSQGNRRLPVIDTPVPSGSFCHADQHLCVALTLDFRRGWKILDVANGGSEVRELGPISMAAKPINALSRM